MASIHAAIVGTAHPRAISAVPEYDRLHTTHTTIKSLTICTQCLDCKTRKCQSCERAQA